MASPPRPRPNTAPRTWQSDQRAGTFINPADSRTTVASWVEQWLPALDVEIRTEEGYRGMLGNHILPRWGSTELAAVSSITVAGWSKQLRHRLAPATVSTSSSCSR